MATIRTVIVDDEAPAREFLASMLAADDAVTIVAQCATGREGIDAIEQFEPDLALLDVHLPDFDGFEVLAKARPRAMPQVIFVTAFDGHAIKAFEVHALDYLLKPFDADRLQLAVRRARARIEQQHDRDYHDRVRRLVEESPTRAGTWDRIAVRENNRVIFIKPEDVDWIEAEGNYVRLHVGKQAHLVRQTMLAVEQRLAARPFVRISRSTLVNLERVREWQPLFYGDSVLVLLDGQRLSATRVYRARLESFLSRLS